MSEMDTRTMEIHAPRLTIRAEEFAIYDNFLPESEFEALAAYGNYANYREVHEKRVRKVWRLHDGTPLQGETAYLQAVAKPDDGQSNAATDAKPIDRFLVRLSEIVDANSQLVGERSTHWKRISASPWIYPMGTGLSLHVDSGRYSGSFTFFLHPRWGLHWGGYLMIFNPKKYCEQATAPYAAGYVLPWLSDEIENKQFEDPGLAVSVFPKSNRLVLISPKAFHMVSRVDVNAGQNPRVTIAGFFVTE
jgi:Rps23 Pro-64 3,4-dihydroxylase Tpa1-like proline 4-hydroxylase